MNKIFSTGPVENAAGNAAITVLIKVLNLDVQKSISAKIIFYKLNGAREKVADSVINIPPLSSEFTSFLAETIREYEVQIEVDFAEVALISVWGLDLDANLIAAQRFVQQELNELPVNSSQPPKRLPRTSLRRGWKKGRL